MSVNYSEMREEAERLSQTLRRNVEVDCVSCPCDYSKLCYLCGGEGRYFRLVFGSCNHSVEDLDSCAENNCLERERDSLDREPRKQIKSGLAKPLLSIRESQITEDCESEDHLEVMA